MHTIEEIFLADRLKLIKLGIIKTGDFYEKTKTNFINFIFINYIYIYM